MATTYHFTVNAVGHLTGEPTPDGGIRISKEQAEDLLLSFGYSLPFDIMAEGYGEDEDWVGICVDDLDDFGRLDPDWGPFEIWAIDTWPCFIKEK